MQTPGERCPQGSPGQEEEEPPVSGKPEEAGSGGTARKECECSYQYVVLTRNN